MGESARKEKNLIRKEVLSRRDSIIAETKRLNDLKIKEKVLALPEFGAAHKILLYASFRSEVDTLDLLKYCLNSGKVIALPKVDNDNGRLTLYRMEDMNEVVAGYMGIPEPQVHEGRRMPVEEMDLIIVPGVAFDWHCNRLGYGKGFYDKLLARGAKAKVALAYEEQIVEHIPSEPYDIKMDKIITDKRIIDCSEII
ncbi:MAG: 5-formyltetrahydrofolate cyclo-ligase [Nitrospirae bacterium]|nr:5-formyltetrahydrofolate cyclo-ligase [Nitrospirota bacterium]